MKVCLYCRVSTTKQELEHQEAACRRLCDYKQFEVARVYSEKISSSKDRPVYLECIHDLRQGLYDGVVVFRIDRLGRNAHELILLLDEFKSKGIKVYSINENLDTDTAIGQAMVDFICILANLERSQIGEATKQRLQSLKADGVRLGQKPLSDFQVKKIKELRSSGLSCRAVAGQMQVSSKTVYNVVYQKGYYSVKTEKDEK